jgi:hypothetical protein
MEPVLYKTVAGVVPVGGSFLEPAIVSVGYQFCFIILPFVYANSTADVVWKL